MIQQAVEYNERENNSNRCKHICIEPFKNNWLSELNVEVIREKVEDMNLDFFASLENDNIIFIDSTYIIRPQGDVLF